VLETASNSLLFTLPSSMHVASVLRPLVRRTLSRSSLICVALRLPLAVQLPDGRRYASKKAKAAASTAQLVPGSKVISTDGAAVEEHGKCDAKMQAAVDWYRREVAASESRAAGRVTPALLSPVRVALPGGQSAKLEEIATVGVKEGTTLVVTVFEEAVRVFLQAGHCAAMADGRMAVEPEAR
jgi:hypothetical protein